MLRLRALRSVSIAVVAVSLSGCTAVDRAIYATENGAYRLLGVDGAEAPPPVPTVDWEKLSWQKLAPNRRDLDAAHFAIIDADSKTGTQRVALKLDEGQALPAFWQEARQTYTVVKGTFVAESVDASGLPQHVDQGPGTFVRVPALMIQHLVAKPGSEAVMFVTVYGDWKLKFLDENQQTAAN